MTMSRATAALTKRPKGCANRRSSSFSVRDLKVSFNTEAGRVDAVRGVNFDLWGVRRTLVS